jgi:hypothetical protein
MTAPPDEALKLQRRADFWQLSFATIQSRPQRFGETAVL